MAIARDKLRTSRKKGRHKILHAVYGGP